MKYISDFQEKGFTEIEVNMPDNLLENTINSFRLFDTHVSGDDKNKTWMTLDETNRKRLGYKDKSDTDGFDNKCYFHYHPQIKEAAVLQGNQYYEDFIDNMGKVYTCLEQVVLSIFDMLDSENIINKSDFIRADGFHLSVLRVLNYKPNESCKELAKPHTDRGFMTLAVYETDSGLHFYYNGGVRNIEYTPGQVKVFPCDDFKQYTNKDIDPTVHNVEKSIQNIERSAIVLFCNHL